MFSIALAAAVETSFGFQTLSSRKFRAGAALNAETKSQAGDPIRFSSVDMEHAEDCAEHFGKCSTKELKQIKEGELQYTMSMSPAKCIFLFF